MSQSPTTAPSTFTQSNRFSPESNQAKRYRLDSDSEGVSEGESRYRNENRHHHPHRMMTSDIPITISSSSQSSLRPSPYEQEYYTSSITHRRSLDANSNNTIDQPHYNPYNNDRGRGYRSNSSYHGSTSTEGLPPLAPRPTQRSMDDHIASNIRQRNQQVNQQQQQQQQPQPDSQNRNIASDALIKKEPTGTVNIRSARGTPKGPLPIETQIGLLRSVLTHDPFNCPIRKTTQAWELISQEQGIKARTCSRRFDNIIQSSISGRDRPIGTEAQQAAKKELLEGLFEMMNRPQALKRMKKKRRYRSEDTDRRLLLETIRLNPFGQKVGQVAKAWEDIRDALNMTVHARQCIRRVNRMVKPYLLRERMCQGNIPDEMKETNDDLVRQIIQLMRSSGQGDGLDDDPCNEDSASGSDSEDQEDAFMDVKDDDAKEDYELDDEDDEEMGSRSASEQRTARKSPGEGVQPSGGTITSSEAPSQSPTAAQPSTPPLETSTSNSAPSSASGPVTPAKRGRPRNPVPAVQPNQSSSGITSDNIRNKSQQDADVITERSKSRSIDVVVLDDISSVPESNHRLIYPSSQIQSTDRYQFPQGRYGDQEYKRPVKHARTDSHGGREYPIEVGHEGYPSRGQPIDPRIRQPGYHPSNRESMDGYSRYGGYIGPNSSDIPENPHPQQFRELVSEMRNIQDYLAGVEEQRRLDMEKQNSMLFMIEKLQHKVQQQQHQLFQLQGHVRYPQQQGAPSSSRSPQNSSYHREPSQHSIHPVGLSTASGGRYSHPIEHRSSAPYQQGASKRSSDHHESYSHPEGTYPSRDHDMQ